MKYTVELDDNFAKALTAASNHDPVSPEYRGDVALAIAALVRMHVRAVLGDTASRESPARSTTSEAASTPTSRN